MPLFRVSCMRQDIRGRAIVFSKQHDHGRDPRPENGARPRGETRTNVLSDPKMFVKDRAREHLQQESAAMLSEALEHESRYAAVPSVFCFKNHCVHEVMTRREKLQVVAGERGVAAEGSLNQATFIVGPGSDFA